MSSRTFCSSYIQLPTRGNSFLYESIHNDVATSTVREANISTSVDDKGYLTLGLTLTTRVRGMSFVLVTLKTGQAYLGRCNASASRYNSAINNGLQTAVSFKHWSSSASVNTQTIGTFAFGSGVTVHDVIFAMHNQLAGYILPSTPG